MKVCILIDSLSSGGAENMVANQLKESGGDISYTVCYLNEPDTLRPALEDAGAVTKQIGENGMLNGNTIRELYKLIRSEQFNVLHCHLPGSILLGRIIGTVAGCESIISTHHNVPDSYSKRSMVLERITRPLDSATVAVSKGVQSGMAEATNKSVRVIYNGVDPDRFTEGEATDVTSRHNIGEDDVVLLNVGRYVPQKSQADLILAMDRVVNDYPNVKLLIVGWGDLEHQLREQVKANDLEHHVEITGFVESIEDYYTTADAFVAASSFEGLPVTFLEAMAAGLPVIGTAVPGITEVVADGKNGYLVPPDDIQKLSNAITKLCRSAVTRSEFGRVSSHLVEEQFSISNTVEEYESLYWDTLST